MRMTPSIVGFALLMGCAPSTENLENEDFEERGPRFITIGADAVGTAEDALAMRLPGARVTPLAANAKVAVLEYDAQDFLRLSHLMHDRHLRCAGFMQHATMAEALQALEGASRTDTLVPAYTIDNPLTTNVMMSELRQSSILTMITDLAAFKNRYYQSPTGAQASDLIRDRWTALAAGRTDVTVSQFTHTGFGQKSVIFELKGTTLPDEIIVLGAHEDSIASGGVNSTAPGADDDASGVATLTELIRVMMVRNFHPQRSIHIMAYAAEEVGLVGSNAIAAKYKTDGKNVVGALQLDMTQFRGSDHDIWLMTDFTTPAQNTFVENLIDRYTGATWSTSACGYACSDHASWQQRGFPASMPFEAKIDEYNENIHTPNDTLAVFGSVADGSVKFARMATAFVAELGKGTVDTSNELIREDFEVNSWATTGLWHTAVSSKCGPGPGFSSPVHALYFGQDATCNFDTGARASGTATSPAITGITANSTLRFRYLRGVQSTNSSHNDVTRVKILANGTKTTVWSRSSLTVSQPRWLMSDTISLTQFAGQSIQIIFEFDSITANNNKFTGWMVDDVVVTK